MFLGRDRLRCLVFFIKTCDYGERSLDITFGKRSVHGILWERKVTALASCVEGRSKCALELYV